MKLSEMKLTQIEQEIILDALSGGSFYEESGGYALGWVSFDDNLYPDRKEFRKALKRLERKGINHDSEDNGEGIRIYWLSSEEIIEIEYEDENDRSSVKFGPVVEQIKKTRKSATNESIEEIVKAGYEVGNYVVVLNDSATYVWMNKNHPSVAVGKPFGKHTKLSTALRILVELLDSELK